MPPLERTDLLQRAVLWPAIGFDSYGQFVVGPPVEIPVRWLSIRREMIDAKGNTIALDGQAVVNLVIPVGSRLWLSPRGTRRGRAVAAWYSLGSAGVPDELMEVKVYNDTPDIKNRNIRTTVGLMRFKDANTP